MSEACRLMMVLAMTDVVTARRRRNLMAETTADVVTALWRIRLSDVVELTDGGYGGSDVVQLTDGGCGGREDEEFHDDETARSR